MLLNKTAKPGENIYDSYFCPLPLLMWLKFNAQGLSKIVFIDLTLGSCVGEATIKLISYH